MIDGGGKRLGPTPLLPLLAPSIGGDPIVAAVAGSVDAALAPVVGAIPRMLLWARLWRDETRLTPALARIVRHTGGLPPLSDEELELLAWQVHVDFWNPAWPREVREDLVKHSTRWHRIKGTPASLKRAFALYGIRAVIEEDGKGDQWATYQIGLADLPDTSTVRLVHDIAREMAPARCRLFRMYTDEFDRRPIVLTEGPDLSGGFLSFYSGVDSDLGDEDGDGPILSFGHRLGIGADIPDPRATFCAEIQFGMRAKYLDKFILGYSQLGDREVRNHGFSFTELASFRWVEPRRVWSFHWRNIRRNQAVPGEDCKILGDCNTRLGVTWAETIDNPPRLGTFKLSEHDCELNRRILPEMFQESRSAVTRPVKPAQVVAGLSQTAAFAAGPIRPPRRWRGKWPSAPWYQYQAGFAVTYHQEEDHPCH